MSHRELHQKMMDAVMSSDFDTYRAMLADDCVNHNPPPGMDGKGADSAVAEMKMWMSAFSGVESTIVQAVEQGDLFAAHVRHKGTNTGDLMGQPATNKSIDVTSTEIVRIENGKVAERWGNVDMMAMMQQLGMMPG